MTAADLLALAQRVEREEPSWELDVGVELAVTPGAIRSTAKGYACWRNGLCYNPPNYTSSLDAAASLVPDGWLLVHASDIGADGLPLVKLANPGTLAEVDGIARRVVQAWAAAALRAIAMEKRRTKA